MTSEEDNANNVSIETVAFCKDPAFPVAAVGTIEQNSSGKLYIWDTSKQVCTFHLCIIFLLVKKVLS